MTEREASLGRALPAYWVCPECGRKFAKRNQGHVHDATTVEDHLAGAPATARALYDTFVGELRKLGPFELAPTKRQIGFQVIRIFAAVRLTKRGLEGYLDLARQVESERFVHVAQFSKRLFVHHFVITDPRELDDQFLGWLGESYEVGWGN